MSRLVLGAVCGLIFGALAAAAMIPLTFPDKRAALTGAFINRLSIGIVIGIALTSTQIPLSGWLVGLALGLLLSAADAVITKAYAPILGLGAIGGAAIGFVVARWGV